MKAEPVYYKSDSIPYLDSSVILCFQARPAAAKAVRALCVRCAAQLSTPAVVFGLIGLAHTALQAQATSPGELVPSAT